MTRSGYNATQGIAEDGRSLLERYFVLDEICRSLSRIPLELEGQPSLYLRSEDWTAAQNGRVVNFHGYWPITGLLATSCLAPANGAVAFRRHAVTTLVACLAVKGGTRPRR